MTPPEGTNGRSPSAISPALVQLGSSIKAEISAAPPTISPSRGTGEVTRAALSRGDMPSHSSPANLAIEDGGSLTCSEERPPSWSSLGMFALDIATALVPVPIGFLFLGLVLFVFFVGGIIWVCKVPGLFQVVYGHCHGIYLVIVSPIGELYGLCKEVL